MNYTNHKWIEIEYSLQLINKNKQGKKPNLPFSTLYNGNAKKKWNERIVLKEQYLSFTTTWLYLFLVVQRNPRGCRGTLFTKMTVLGHLSWQGYFYLFFHHLDIETLLIKLMIALLTPFNLSEGGESRYLCIKEGQVKACIHSDFRRNRQMQRIFTTWVKNTYISQT